MRQVKKLLFSILLMLALEAGKRFFLDPSSVSYSFFYNLLSCIQLAVLLTAVISLFFKKILFGVIAFFALATLAEVVCAALLSNPAYIPKLLMPAFSFYYDRFDCRFIQYDSSMSRFDARLYYSLKENSNFIYSNAEFSDSFYVNSLGLRDDEVSLLQPQVICIGDSYTLGWGVKQNETFPQLIEKQFGMKVLNLSMSSYGTARESLALQKIDSSAMKYIIWQYSPNDADENRAFIDSAFRYTPPSPQRYAYYQQMHEWTMKYFPGKHFLTISKLLAGNLAGKNYGTWTKPSITASEAAQNFLSIVRHSGIKANVKLIIFELSNYQMKNEFTEQLKLLLKSDTNQLPGLNIEVMDFSDILKKEDYYLLDDHINANGHAKIADAILNQIKKKSD